MQQHDADRFRDDGIHFARLQDVPLHLLILHHTPHDPDLFPNMRVRLAFIGRIDELSVNTRAMTEYTATQRTISIFSAIDDASRAITCAAPAWADMNDKIPEPNRQSPF